MKTLDKLKREVAYSFAHPDWDSMVKTCRHSNNEVFNNVVERLCQLYGKETAKQALNIAAEGASHNEVKHKILSTEIQLP